MLTRKVRKVGSSHVIGIPADILAMLDLQAGDSVTFNVNQNLLIIQKYEICI